MASEPWLRYDVFKLLPSLRDISPPLRGQNRARKAGYPPRPPTPVEQKIKRIGAKPEDAPSPRGLSSA